MRKPKRSSATRRAGLRDRRGLPREHAERAAVAGRPVDRRAGGDDDEADVRDQHAAARPVVLVDERPLLAAELALADLPAARGEEARDARAHVGFVALDVERRVQRDVSIFTGAQRRQARRDHAPERRDRQRDQDQPDDRDVRRRVIDVVEVQAQHDARQHRRVVLPVEVGVFALVDDHADQREEAPHGEQRDGEQNVGEERPGTRRRAPRRARGLRRATPRRLRASTTSPAAR